MRKNKVLDMEASAKLSSAPASPALTPRLQRYHFLNISGPYSNLGVSMRYIRVIYVLAGMPSLKVKMVALASSRWKIMQNVCAPLPSCSPSLLIIPMSLANPSPCWVPHPCPLNLTILSPPWDGYLAPLSFLAFWLSCAIWRWPRDDT